MGTLERAELDWLAFCYVAGEMSAEEFEGFEDRLATDQVAREAVAGAVKLSQAVALASAVPNVRTVSLPDSQDGRWRRRTGWTVVSAVAACLALMLTLNAWQHPDPIDLQMADAEASRLVEVWVESQAGTDDQDALPLNGDLDDVGDDDLSVPDWLLAAVATDSEQDGQHPDSAWEDN